MSVSVVLTASADAAALARTLAALVPAATDGLVRDVAVIGAAGASQALADDAGAALYPTGGFGQAAARARGDWLCGLPLGVEFTPDWMEQVAAHVARAPPAPARLVGTRLLGSGPEGWLAPSSGSVAVATEQDLQRLARRARARLRILWRG